MTTDLRPLAERAAALVSLMRQHGLMLVTAESCTGGLLAGVITEVPGSSAVLDRGFVTYSNAAKSEMLGVPAALIEAQGAVSPEVAAAMAEGALSRSNADLAVAVTGVAGPDGGSAQKPVGLVHFAVAVREGRTHNLERRYGDIGRAGVRSASLETALELIEKTIGCSPTK